MDNKMNASKAHILKKINSLMHEAIHAYVNKNHAKASQLIDEAIDIAKANKISYFKLELCRQIYLDFDPKNQDFLKRIAILEEGLSFYKRKRNLSRQIHIYELLILTSLRASNIQDAKKYVLEFDEIIGALTEDSFDVEQLPNIEKSKLHLPDKSFKILELKTRIEQLKRHIYKLQQLT
ncbi:MAG: hypothetical protein ABI700_02170 [Chloroflexota bacterium]